MRTIMKKNNLVPPEFSFNNSFYITLFDKDFVRKNEPVNEPVNVRENIPEKRLINILDIIKSNNIITVSEITEILNVSRETIKRDIIKLKETGKLKRVGHDKGGSWKVLR